MEPYYRADNAEIYHGLSADVLRALPDNSIDAVVTDAPYGIAFMGKKWDYELPSVETWVEVLRVLKPGGHLLAFGGPRTYHRAVCRIEDAGFEIRDCLMWIFGSGFPKSLDVSKAIDKAAGADRKVLGRKWESRNGGGLSRSVLNDDNWREPDITDAITAPATEAAQQWEGWGTALKPAHEPIVLARKPLDGTVAANVQTWGVGAMNIDGCRIDASGDSLGGGKVSTRTEGWDRPWKSNPDAVAACKERGEAAIQKAESLGRWPANLIHDGSDEVVELFPETASGGGDRGSVNNSIFCTTKGEFSRIFDANSGSAARFFYCAKATAEERNKGLDHLPERVKVYNGQAAESSEDMKPVEKRFTTKARNTHPTVKPLALMRYLCRLICPPDGVILDPFFGSGSTGVAAIQEGFRIIGIDADEHHCEIAKGRVSHAVRVIEKNPALPFEDARQAQEAMLLFMEMETVK